MARVMTCVHCGRIMFDASGKAWAVRCCHCGRLSAGPLGSRRRWLHDLLPLVLVAMMLSLVFSAYWLGRTVERERVRELRNESR